MKRRHVVSAFLMHRGKLVLFRRSGKVSTYRHLWATVSGSIERDPLHQAYKEIREETGLRRPALGPPLRGLPGEIFDEALSTLWVVHPFRFELKAPPELSIDWEHTEMRWIEPRDMQKLATVPGLLRAYVSTFDKVPPWHGEAFGLRADRTSGAAEIARKAVANLRDALGRSKRRTRKGLLAELARMALAQARERPTMVSLGNAMATAVRRLDRKARGASSLEAFRADADRTLELLLDRMNRAVLGAATAAAALCPQGCRLMTLSYSSTIMKLLDLLAADPLQVVVLESRPALEGRRTARTLARAGIDTTVAIDGAAFHLVGEVDRVMVGADAVLPGGSVVNKTGTHAAAAAGREAGAKVFAVCEALKISPEKTVELEDGPASEILARPPKGLNVANPQFEVTPAALFDGIITERGLLGPTRVASLAAEFRKDHLRMKRIAGER